MKFAPPEVRTHRILGAAAIVHSLLVLVLLVAIGWVDSTWTAVTWITFATLWFVWPIVLIVHRGRSFLRVTTPLLAAYLFYFFWSTPYSSTIEKLVGGPQKFGFPFGVELTPHSIAGYFVSYAAGWVRGKLDAKQHRLVLEGYGFGFSAPRTPNFSQEAAKRCGIEFLPVSGCIVNERIVGHAYGRNDVTMAELRRRFPAEVKAAEDEEARWHQSYVDGEKAGRAEAEADLRAGRLAIVVDDPERSDDAAFEKWLREKYQLGLKHVDPRSDPKTSNNLFGYAHGYNEIADAEIQRRFGKDTDYEIWGEWAKIPAANPLPH